jgi:hypothetical protein
MKKIQQPTPAKWSQLAAACTATGTMIEGTAYGTQNIYVFALGLLFLITGTFIPFFKGE